MDDVRYGISEILLPVFVSPVFNLNKYKFNAINNGLRFLSGSMTLVLNILFVKA